MSSAGLGYLFWHVPPAGADRGEYEAALVDWQDALVAHPPSGYRRGWTWRLAAPPWLVGWPDEVYLDGYVVADFTALGTLNADAPSGPLASAHDSAACRAAYGAGGAAVRLPHGDRRPGPRHSGPQRPGPRPPGCRRRPECRAGGDAAPVVVRQGGGDVVRRRDRRPVRRRPVGVASPTRARCRPRAAGREPGRRRARIRGLAGISRAAGRLISSARRREWG